jgi:predicted PhzF superfamily epimerase YddE/YHI9
LGLDRLIEYGVQPLPDTTKVVNPQWRQLDSQLRSQRAVLSRELCRLGDIQLPADLDPKQVEACARKKGELQHSIESRRLHLEQLKIQRKALHKHIPIKELSASQRFSQLRLEKKHFIDTIKLIAYRAESAMAQVAREQMHRLEDARALMRQLYRTEADLIPDQINKTLTVRLHPLSANVHDQAIRHLCDELNASETLFPGTHMRLIYEIIGSP